MIRASGILFLTPANTVLLLKRSEQSDWAGAWAFPGGRMEPEDDDSTEACADREAHEEVGAFPGGERKFLCRQISPAAQVDFTTYLQKVPGEFTPTLNDEHDAFVWVHLDELASDSAVRADEEWNESDHPRGQPENAGQFGSGGGSSKTSSSGSHHATKVEGGKRVTASGDALPAHIQALKIPPAWTDVTFNPDPKGSLQATGKDSKGRRQAVYSAEFSAKQAAAKFARINELNQKIGYIKDQNEEARASDNPKKAAAADCTKLIMTTGIRPGSDEDTGAKVKAYGATTLEGKHVVIDGNSVTLKFVGKKGVSLNIPVEDAETATMLKQRKEQAGDDAPLFPINEKTLLAHVHSLDGGNFKTKDFRTLLGTTTAIKEVRSIPPPVSMADYKKKVMAVAKIVSTKLGNTPTIALQSYINPSVFADWRIAV